MRCTMHGDSCVFQTGGCRPAGPARRWWDGMDWAPAVFGALGTFVGYLLGARRRR